MGKELQGLQLLGAFRIVREAFNILLRSSCTKLLAGLTLSLLLPLSFAMLGHTFVSEPLVRKIAWMKVILYYQIEAGSTASERTLRELTSRSGDLIVFVATVITFIYAFWLVSTAVVVYTVASIYTADAKNLSYVRVMRIVPRVWDRLWITYFWNCIIFLVFYIATGLALFLLTFFSVGAGYKLNSGGFVFSSILTILVFICAYVYISTVWYLASVISVLEDKFYGLAAMRKSKNLMKGKQMTALALVIPYFIFSGGIQGVFWYAVVDGGSHGVGIAARAVYGTLLVGLLCFVNLMGLLTQSVFYFECKSYFHESIDDKYCWEVYNYMSLSSSSVSLWRICLSTEGLSIDLSLI